MTMPVTNTASDTEAGSVEVSVLTVVGGHDADRLGSCLDALGTQRGPTWEHVIVRHGSVEPAVDALVRDWAAGRHRVTVVDGAEDRSCTPGVLLGEALQRAVGRLVTVLDPDDVLAADALTDMATPFGAHGDTVDVVYADHAVPDSSGLGMRAWLAPDFSPERLRGQNYVGRVWMATRELIDDIGGFPDTDPAAFDHDVVLRLVERARSVVHVPVVCSLQRRPSPGGSEAAESVRVVAAHCARIGVDVTVEPASVPGAVRLRRCLHDRPLVSVVLPTCASRGRVWGIERTFVLDAVRSIVARSAYQAVEFVVVHDSHTPPEALVALRRLAGDRMRSVPFAEEFNFSAKVDVGVEAAAGEVVLLLNDDTELIAPDSIEVMLGHLQDPGVGMVGARLLYADGTLQHGGHVYHHQPMHVCLGWRGDSPGPAPTFPLAVAHEVGGVTAAAAMVRRSTFREIGGFDVSFPSNYNDVDFSLRLRSAGHRIVWTPDASWYHFEGRTRDGSVHPDETARLDERWHDELRADPYYHPRVQVGRHDWLEDPTVLSAVRFGVPSAVAARRREVA